jgi:hypothetical protein
MPQGVRKSSRNHLKSIRWPHMGQSGTERTQSCTQRSQNDTSGPKMMLSDPKCRQNGFKISQNIISFKAAANQRAARKQDTFPGGGGPAARAKPVDIHIRCTPSGLQGRDKILVRFLAGPDKVFRWVTPCRRPLPKVQREINSFRSLSQDPKNVPNLLTMVPTWNPDRVPNPYKCSLGALRKQVLKKMLTWDTPKVAT